MIEGARAQTVAVAVDKNKNSQIALKWALDNVVSKGQVIFLVHVKTKHSSTSFNQEDAVPSARDVLVPYRCFCRRKNISCKDIILEDTDVARAILDFVVSAAVEILILGASKGGFIRSFRSVDTSTMIHKHVPDFCTVYVISKGRISYTRKAIRPAPRQANSLLDLEDHHHADSETWKPSAEQESNRGMRHQTMRYSSNSSNSASNSSRASIDRLFTQQASDLDSKFLDSEPLDGEEIPPNIPYFGIFQEEIKAEMQRLRLQLKQTMKQRYCMTNEALAANKKAMQIRQWKLEAQTRTEDGSVIHAIKEQAKHMAALESAAAANRIAERESRRRIGEEKKALEESNAASCTLANSSYLRCRIYSIEEIEIATDYFAERRKIGEGGYGPVYRCHLDHTPVAVKVLRPDAAQGQAQFKQEVEILSCIRHPCMVLLLGACPEYGCLVYEYMANGSLEDRLFRRGNTPAIPWQHRFRIAAEIGTGLLFLHQNKPEPLVHRDLKPANILLDQNYVSKIGDVGLARLVPPSVADNVTQYHMTSAAGTFCYIDPEYQQTGMLGIKSDVYSFGVLLLQLLTARSPMGLTHQVELSIENDSFAEMLDPAVQDWPVEEALCLAKLSLKCAELRRKDRPDLKTVVMPELNRLKVMGEENMEQLMRSNRGCSTIMPRHEEWQIVSEAKSQSIGIGTVSY
ncbi:U-box domain-containing protein 51-like [Zingiber officinale]|uniref:U-box domain-containing protein 51-like n=1 Tax=Zingiber officinale TaxID=94328 RepID=UPI001C4AB85F|nr:U-box domain-containing protein 51-like [Zingiber officinale]